MTRKTYFLLFLWGFACYFSGTIDDISFTLNWWMMMVPVFVSGLLLALNLPDVSKKP